MDDLCKRRFCTVKKKPHSNGFTSGTYISCKTYGGEVLAKLKPELGKPEFKLPQCKGDPKELPLEKVIPPWLKRERLRLERAGKITLGDVEKGVSVKRVGTQTHQAIQKALKFYRLSQLNLFS